MFSFDAKRWGKGDRARQKDFQRRGSGRNVGWLRQRPFYMQNSEIRVALYLMGALIPNRVGNRRGEGLKKSHEMKNRLVPWTKVGAERAGGDGLVHFSSGVLVSLKV